MPRTETDIMVKVRDLSEFKKWATEAYNEHEDQDADTMGFDGPWATVDVDGELYAVCSEGVGPRFPITKHNPLKVTMRPKTYDDERDGYSVPMVPVGHYEIVPEDLRDAPVNDKKPLHEFIRSTGGDTHHRLDQNYEKFRRLLEFKRSDELGYAVIHQPSGELVEGDFLNEQMANDYIDFAINNDLVTPPDCEDPSEDEFINARKQYVVEPETQP